MAHLSWEQPIKLVRLWEQYHEDYTTTMPEYHSLLRQLKSKRVIVKKIPESQVKECWPHIPFLKLTSKEAVEEEIARMTSADASQTIRRIERDIIDEFSFYQSMRKNLRLYRRKLTMSSNSKTYVPTKMS